MKNEAPNHFSAADQTIIDGLIAQLEAVFDGKLEALTAEERQRYGSINEQNKLLVNKVADYRLTHPFLSSPDVNWAEFEKDNQTRHFLETRQTSLQNLASRMESTKIMHDYDSYHAALDDYAYTQYQIGVGKSGAVEKAAELKTFFPRSGTGLTPEGS